MAIIHHGFNLVDNKTTIWSLVITSVNEDRFSKYITDRAQEHYVYVTRLPPHLNYVATLSCEIWIFKITFFWKQPLVFSSFLPWVSLGMYQWNNFENHVLWKLWRKIKLVDFLNIVHVAAPQMQQTGTKTVSGIRDRQNFRW